MSLLSVRRERRPRPVKSNLKANVTFFIITTTKILDADWLRGVQFQKECNSGVQFKKYKTFSLLIYSYINTSGNWKNEKLCGNMMPAGRSVFTQFRVFPIFTSVDITVYQYGKNVLYFFYNIAQRTLAEEWREIFRVDIELHQHGS